MIVRCPECRTEFSPEFGWICPTCKIDCAMHSRTMTKEEEAEKMIFYHPVERPAHYNKGDIECIDAIRSALGIVGFQAFCRGQVIKYTWRATHKGAYDEDIAKAIFYAKMAADEDPREYKKEAPKNGS